MLDRISSIVKSKSEFSNVLINPMPVNVSSNPSGFGSRVTTWQSYIREKSNYILDTMDLMDLKV